MSATIFISFASQDRKVALTLCQTLESRGFQCWISARDIAPGENFQIAIVQAIRRAKIMLLVFTANSNNSQEMTKELALASQQKMMVVPLRIEDVTPNDAFAYEFATRQWIDFFADWEFAIDQLSRRLTYALGQEVPPAAAAGAAKPVKLSIAPEAEPEPQAEPELQDQAAEARPTLPRVALEDADEPLEPVRPPPKPRAKAKPAAPEPETPPPAAAEPEILTETEAADQARSGRRWMMMAAALLIVVGVGLAAPMLARKKTAAQADTQPVAAAKPAPGSPAPTAAITPAAIAPVQAAAAAPPPAAEATTATTVADEATANETAPAPPPPKRKARKANPHAESALPY